MAKFQVAVTPNGEWLVFSRELLEIESVVASEAEASALADELNRRPDFDFEALYREFPKSGGKATGLKWLKAHVKSRKKFEAIYDAIRFYVEECSVERRDPKYIKRFDFWLKQWENYREERPLPPATLQLEVPL